VFNYHAMKMYWGVKVLLHAFPSLALVGGESGQLHAPATLCQETSPQYALDRRLAGPHN